MLVVVGVAELVVSMLEDDETTVELDETALEVEITPEEVETGELELEETPVDVAIELVVGMVTDVSVGVRVELRLVVSPEFPDTVVEVIGMEVLEITELLVVPLLYRDVDVPL